MTMNGLTATRCLAGVLLASSINDGVLADVPIAYHVVSKATGVPADILYAVALTESGKAYEAEGGRLLPWPWALNINGVGVYCANLDAALVLSREAIQQRQLVDIGLMQISWRWHEHRFQGIEQALSPMRNLQAGATILREHYDLTKDWWIAVGRYHDPGQDDESLASAERYRNRVRRHWERVF